jgi:hypothetical protein
MRVIHFVGSRGFGQMRWWIPAAAFCLLLCGCNLQKSKQKPDLQITRIPMAGAGGPAEMDYIAGLVTGAASAQRIVLYAQSMNGIWWVQPFAKQPFTQVEPDSTWKNSTHLGTHYAALLVQPDYVPPLRIAALPPVGNGVVAEAIVQGQGSVNSQKILHFSGYDWIVRSAESQRGGEFNAYDPENVWTDQNGYLHLRMTMRNGKWTCAELSLTRSLGFGSYKFVVQDASHLPSTAVFGMYTWDEAGTENFHNELDIELSRWGNKSGMNGQFIIQPFYVPENVFRFMAPPGVVTFGFLWEPGSASFRAIRGAAITPQSGAVSAHTFTTGIPSAATESVHIDLYDFHHSSNSSQQPVEVVIEKFEFLP